MAQRDNRVLAPYEEPSMLGNMTGVFSEPDDYAVALRAEGCLGLVVTGRGQFRAQLTRVGLHRLRLSATEERLSRIAFFAVPTDIVLLTLPREGLPLPICGGIAARPGEIMTLGPGEQLHSRTVGSSKTGAIWLPIEKLVRYSGALTGRPFTISPAVQRWRPQRKTLKELQHLFAAAIRMTLIRPQDLIDAEAAHGLEQQLIHVIVECLAAGTSDTPTRPGRRRQDLMSRFERLLHAQPERGIPISEICATLGVSERLLRGLCSEHLGMGPMAYDRRRRMLLVRQALLRKADETTVAAVAAHYGFHSPGRFAVNYREAFGELPSKSLQRGNHR